MGLCAHRGVHCAWVLKDIQLLRCALLRKACFCLGAPLWRLQPLCCARSLGCTTSLHRVSFLFSCTCLGNGMSVGVCFGFWLKFWVAHHRGPSTRMPANSPGVARQVLFFHTCFHCEAVHAKRKAHVTHSLIRIYMTNTHTYTHTKHTLASIITTF